MDGRIDTRLEIMSEADGKRKVIYEASKGFEAPNYMPAGKKLLFNEGGSLAFVVARW
jgi:hypothetical protein